MPFLFNNTQGFVVGLFTLVIAGAMMAYVFLRRKEEVVMMEEEVKVAMMTPALLRIVKHGYSLSWFKQRVFPYLGPNIKDTIELRSYCKLFRDSLDLFCTHYSISS